MMAAEWQLGKVALTRVFEPSMVSTRPIFREQESLIPQQTHAMYNDYTHATGPIIDSMELLDDHQRLMTLAAKREETWEASTESDLLHGEFSSSSRRADAFVGPHGVKMTRTQRIQQKLLREQEEVKKEQRYETTKMVHELKDALGRRWHLKEGDDDNGDEEQLQEQPPPSVQHMASKRPSLIPTCVFVSKWILCTVWKHG
jgi:hypothetical protein